MIIGTMRWNLRGLLLSGLVSAGCDAGGPPLEYQEAVDAGPTTDSGRPLDARAATDAPRPADLAATPDGPGADAPADVISRYDVPAAPDAPTCDAGGACAPRPDGCVGRDTCGDGLDNNCDGRVDETCPCVPGTVQRCFLGPPGRRGLGACSDGNQTCVGLGEFGTWSECAGGIPPSAETCDGADNNCDGCADDGLCCRPAGTCPSAGDPRVPTGRPFAPYTLRGATFFPGPARAWRWRVVGGPCDQLIYATRSRVSYRLGGATAADPRVSEADTLDFNPTLSGDYTVTLTVTAMDGAVFECTFVVSVRAPGLRVELCWDRTGNPRATTGVVGGDVDLWLHSPRGTGTWGFPPGFERDETCGPYNCFNRDADIPPIFLPSRPNWGYAATAGGGCRTPEGGACRNPRLDLDNNGLNDATHSDVDPENVNVDNPRDGDEFRVAAYYWRGSVPVQPMINIYCGGSLRATFGGAVVGGTLYGSSPVAGFTGGRGGFDTSSSFWRVADVRMRDAGTGCDVVPLVPTAAMSGACVQTGTDRTFAGPCRRRLP